MDKFVSEKLLQEYEASFDKERANAVAMAAVTNNGINKTAKNYETLRKDRHEYSLNLKQGKITAQKQSGRCWMFAALNTMRFRIIHKLNLETLELSQNYTLFYDKLEKSNYFFENVLETLDEKDGSRIMDHLLLAPLNDGGQWDMLCCIVKKYGLVPKDAMPETVVSSCTREMNAYLTEKLREGACKLRKAHQAGKTLAELRAMKEELLAAVYNILCICLGKPPKTFTFEATSKDGKFLRDENLTPQAFYDKYIGVNLDDYVSLINAPTQDKPFGKSYTVRFLGNVREGRKVRYLNLPIAELKKAAIAQLKDGEPVWFGCDVGKRSARDEGIMDLDIYKLEEVLGTSFTMDKGERLTYGQSLMTHAMVFQGVNLDAAGNPLRWRVENSWGEGIGDKGFCIMSDAWFDQYLYQVVVNKKYLSAEQLAAYAAEPIVLEPWDPMGSLA